MMLMAHNIQTAISVAQPVTSDAMISLAKRVLYASARTGHRALQRPEGQDDVACNGWALRSKVPDLGFKKKYLNCLIWDAESMR